MSLRDPSQPTISAAKLAGLRRIRTNHHFQPNMYFYIDSPSVRIVCIDTGIKGVIDDKQAAWLRRISDSPHRKILVTGPRIYVNGRKRKGFDDVLGIVEKYHYLLVVGGDTHNFQRYRISHRAWPIATIRVACRQRGRRRVPAAHRCNTAGARDAARSVPPGGKHRLWLLPIAAAVGARAHGVVEEAGAQLGCRQKPASVLQELPQG